MLCEHCGRDNPEGARFCAFCGGEMKPAQRPASKPKPTRKPAGAVQDVTGRETVLPGRKPPVEPDRTSTIIPRRVKRTRQDLFFEDIPIPSEPDDELEDSGLGARRVKSAVAGVLLLLVLWLVFWLLVMPGGQAFRAGLGLPAPASAYKTLGEQYLREGSVRRAAEAYNRALSLDPQNYEYALAVGKTQEAVGDYNRALSAYALCITLKETAAEPYQAAASLYQQMGETEKARNALKSGYDRTGSLDLFRAFEAMG